MILNIRHQTVCRYDRPVPYTVQQLRLTPRAEDVQRAVRWQIRAPGHRRQLTDAYGNVAHLLTIDAPHDEISITVEGVVETADEGAYVLAASGLVSPYAYLAATALTMPDEYVIAFARRHLKLERHRVRALLDLMPPISEHVRPAPPPSPGQPRRTAAQALAAGHGAGRDHAHVFIACCRASGIPARYVSGYLYSGSANTAASHAWADAWVDGHGWMSFDVTHQRLADGSYCRLAIGRDDLDACPVRAVRAGAGEERLEVTLGVAN